MKDFVRVGNFYFDPISVGVIEVGAAKTLFVWIEGASSHMTFTEFDDIKLFFTVMQLDLPEEFQ